MRKKLPFALLCLGLALALQFISSCRHEVVVPTTLVCFDQDVFPIINSNCNLEGCHNKGHRSFTSYDNIMSSGVISPGNARKSEMYKKITTDLGPMPPSPHQRLTDDQIREIYVWILQGAKHTICDTTGNICDSVNVTYSATINPIIEANCIPCHSGSNPSGGLSLGTYSDLVGIINDGNFQTQVINYSGNPMPPSGKLNTCQIAQFKKWIADEMPNK